MTRKDYVKFAELLRVAKFRCKLAENYFGSPEALIEFFELELADIFAVDNPNFDRKRFSKACEPKGKEQSK